MLALLTRILRVDRRFRRRLPVAVLIAAVALAGCTSTSSLRAAFRDAAPPSATQTEPPVEPTPTPTPDPTPSPTPTTKKPAPATTKAQPPSAQWQYATTPGPVLGSGGSSLTYAVTVEAGLSMSPADFAAKVNATLGDPRSWIAGGLTLQQVRQGDSPSFTIYLAKPSTAYLLCLPIDTRVGGVPYTSCRMGNRVVINSDRWFYGVANYGASQDAYRQYVINHEVGHRLGHGHELCPGPGQPAPVMEQQTLGLHGCVANSWPYLNGSLYSGPPV